ncbi:MAG: FAD-binding oxidoreductase [bacterium]
MAAMPNVKAMRCDNTVVELDGGAIDALKARLRGGLLTPADAGYDDARSLWNAMIDRRPALIARCAGAADVVACVEFARARGLLLSIKGGGHNIAGLAVCDGGLMLDMSPMRGVWVDAADRIAHAQAGCLLADVDRETQVHGLATVLGFVSATGIAGLTLGGGFGYLTRKHGWTTDNVRSIDIVTAEGRLVRASERENADLFWGLRGGGGNFGVATSFEYALHPVGPEIIAGAIAWRAEEAPAVLEMYRDLMSRAPRELTCAAVLRMAPPAPWIAKEAHGKPIVVIFFCHAGSIADGEHLAAPLKRFGAPVGDIVQRRSYASQQMLLDAVQPKGRRYYWKSEYVRGLEPQLFADAIEHAARIPSPHSAIVVFPIDGAINSVAEEHSPVGNRSARAVLNITSSWEAPDGDAENIEWARATWRGMRHFSTGGAYINFMTEDEGGDRIAAAYGANHARLVDVKSKWDPTNMFRVNKNIAPRA